VHSRVLRHNVIYAYTCICIFIYIYTYKGREERKEEKCSVRFSDCFSRHDRRKRAVVDTEAKYGVRSKWITAPHRPISLSIYQTAGPPVFIYIIHIPHTTYTPRVQNKRTEQTKQITYITYYLSHSNTL